MKRWLPIAFLSCIMAFSACNRPVETRHGTSLPSAASPQLQAVDSLMWTREHPFSRICNSGAVSISIFNAKKTILPCFSEKMLIFAAEKELVAMRTTAIERGLQIPILDTSEFAIRWNGIPLVPIKNPKAHEV